MFVNISIWPLVAHVRSITEIANTYTRVWSAHHASFAWSVRQPQHFFYQIYDELRENLRNHNHYILCAAMRWLPITLVLTFFQHVNLSFDLIQPLFRGWARCLVTWALHISTRSKYTHFKINFMFIDLVWFKSKPNLKYDASVAVTAVAWNCDNMCSNAIAHFTFHSQPCIFQHCIFVLQEIGITLEIDVLLQWNNVYLCHCSWCFFFISFFYPKYLHTTRSNVMLWNICPFDKWSHTIHWVSLIYEQ